jgi:hypothetical protein
MYWSSRSGRLSGRDESWTFDWPGPIPGIGPKDNVVRTPAKGIGTWTLRNEGAWTHPVLVVPVTNDVGLMSLQLANDPLTIIAGTGTVTLAAGETVRLCFSPDGCQCPTGTSSNAIQMTERSVTIAMPARGDKTSAQAANTRWDPKKECREKDPERARANGDPHMQTFDGLRYDAMTLGEFVYARDPDGGFEVQARHVAGTLAGAAFTKAVAVSDGTDRITFTFHGDGFGQELEVRANGDPVAGTEITAGGLTVSDADDLTVTWPDGSRAVLHAMLGSWFVELEVPAERAARLEGLLGAANDDLRDDLKLPDGTLVDVGAAEGTEAPHSLAWQVTDSTSLFDYRDGESVATFRIPHPNPEPIAPAEEDLERCRDQLGPQAMEWEIQWCAFDVTTSGEERYVEPYTVVVQDRIEDDRPRQETFAPVPDTTTTTGPDGATGQEGEPTLTLEGTLVAPYTPLPPRGTLTVVTGSVEAEEGTVLMARTASCDTDTRLTLTATERATQSSTFKFLCDPGGLNGWPEDADDDNVNGETFVWIPAAGTYDLKVDSDSENPLPVVIDVFVDPTPTVVRGAELARGASVRLEGVGDTAVFVLGLDPNTYEVSGLDEACAVVSFGAPVVGTRSPWGLDRCGHVTDPPAVGNAGFEVPLVVWTRTADPVEVALRPG